MGKACILFIIFPFQIFCQTRICGFLKDSVTNQPVEFASVYVNETTIGTTSDTLGYFCLERISVPCEIVFSHVSYQTHVIVLNILEAENLLISLSPKKIKLPEYIIQDKDLRNRNVEFFKKCFLGNDYWGKQAILENDSVLFFYLKYLKNACPESLNKAYLPEITDNWANEIKNLEYLKVVANGPLEINLPLLGYYLHVDLVSFEMKFLPENKMYEYKYFGYFHYLPVETTKKDQRKINKNRSKVYYNSSMHFCRSLYEKKLKENGYLVYEEPEKDDSIKYPHIKEFGLDSCLVYTSKDLALIQGLADKKLFIHYFKTNSGKPMNMAIRENDYPVISEIIFMSDACTIRANGTIPPNSSIMFRRYIAEKNVGASLPGDYKVEK